MPLAAGRIRDSKLPLGPYLRSVERCVRLQDGRDVLYCLLIVMIDVESQSGGH